MPPSTLLTAATLACWSGVFLAFHLSGRLVHFLHPAFRPPILLAGIVLALLAAAILWAGRRAPETANAAPECADPDCGDDCDPAPTFGPAQYTSLILLTLTLAGATLIAPDTYGRATVENRGIIDTPQAARTLDRPAPAPSAPPADLPPATDTVVPPAASPLDKRPIGLDSLNAVPPAPGLVIANQDTAASMQYATTPQGNLVTEVVDLLYASEEKTLRQDFDGKNVEIIGQYLPARDLNPDGNRFRLVRLFVTCCAADARPVSILIQTSATPAPATPDMGWLKIRGKATFPTIAGHIQPIIEAATIEAAQPPAEPLLY